MTKQAGKCLCGAVTIQISETKEEVSACHCKMCQRWTGSALISAALAPDAISLEGEESVGRYASSDWAERAFCTQCGSGLFYKVTAPGAYQGFHYVPVGLFDDATGYKLGEEIFYDSRAGFFAYAGDTSKKTGAEVMAEFSA